MNGEELMVVAFEIGARAISLRGGIGIRKGIEPQPTQAAATYAAGEPAASKPSSKQKRNNAHQNNIRQNRPR